LSSVHRFCGGKTCLGFFLPQTPLMWEPPALGLSLFSLQNMSVDLNENLTIFSSAICSLNLRPNYNIYVSLIKHKLVLPPWANFLLCNHHVLIVHPHGLTPYCVITRLYLIPRSYESSQNN
jgi:hypothetical protein